MSPHLVDLWALIPAAGGGDGDHSIKWFEIASMALNFVLLFGFLIMKIKPALGRHLVDRRSNMEKQLQEAREKQQKAETELQEYKEKLAHLEEEVARVVSSYEAEAQAESDRLRDETAKAIDRLARESDFTIKQEIRKAEKAIREASVDATLEMAESLIKSRITDADRRRLVDQYISSLESAPRA